MEFEAYLGAPKSYDAVYITGNPNMEVVLEGGAHGDVATAAITVNAIPQVIKAKPGLLTMLDINPVHAFNGNWSGLIS